MAVRKPGSRQHGAQGGNDTYLRPFRVGDGLPALSVLVAEVMDMWDVLLGRVSPPMSYRRVDALMEVANAYYARAAEITSLILKQEREGRIQKSSGYSKFRTGELRHFMEVASKTTELGSRRVTMRQLQQEAERTGREKHA